MENRQLAGGAVIVSLQEDFVPTPYSLNREEDEEPREGGGGVFVFEECI